MTTFTKTNEQLAARRARVKEMEMQGRVFNSAMRARAVREAKRMQKIEDIADNIIAGLQSNPNVKREVVKVEPIEYIDTTGFDIVNLGSADKDSYSNHRRAEYSNTKKLENAADAILKELQAEAILNELQSEDDDNSNSDEEVIVENNNSETDEDDDINEEDLDNILNMIQNEDDADNYMDENDDDNNDTDEIELDDILNAIRNEDDDNNNSDEDEESGYYEYSELQESIVNHLTKTGYYQLKDGEFHKYFNEIQPLIDMNIVTMDNDGILYSV